MKSIKRAHIAVVTDRDHGLVLTARLPRMDVTHVTTVARLDQSKATNPAVGAALQTRRAARRGRRVPGVVGMTAYRPVPAAAFVKPMLHKAALQPSLPLLGWQPAQRERFS